MAYQSLYRRYRPQKFSEIRGQRHVVNALQNAVVKAEVGHAYLLHGPRGTGKTTSARVLAKALNCENLGADGEPCGQCESCHAIEEGRSFDLHELDAASNNKVEDMRDLLGKVNLGNPGRAKVYILDEVHMLTSQAENALLKTLEEPPSHVTWVLATTEPHKVVDTIRSRCQVFELTLLDAEEMADHVRWVIADAGLDVDEAAVDYVVQAGGGSVRDTLSALDRVVAAGGTIEIDTSTDVILDALAARDVGAALAAVGDASGRGRDPRTIGEGVLAGLRDAFLTAMGAPPPRLSQVQHKRAEHIAALMSAAAMTRALETLGTALVEMRQAPDPRVDLEVALVRLCRPDVDRSLDALTERIDRLEQQTQTTVPAPAPTGPAPAVPATAPDSTRQIEPAESVEPVVDGPAAAARRVLAQKRGAQPAEAKPAPTTEVAPPPPVPMAAAPVSAADADQPEPAVVLSDLRPASPTEVVQLAGIHLGLGKEAVVSRAEALLGPASGGRSPEDLRRLWLSLINPPQPEPEPEPESEPDGDPGPTPPESDEIDLHDLVDAPSHTDHLIERLTDAFPGAELHTTEESTES